MARGKLTIRGKRTPENVRKEIQEKILARLMSGEHLTAICRSKEMPELKSIYQWLQTDAVLRSAIHLPAKLRRKSCATRLWK